MGGKEMKFAVVLLAGGTGTRMKSSVPKQYIKIRDKTLALYSFEVFASMLQVEDLIVVCEKEYEPIFEECAALFHRRILFARPGKRRQDSVWNGISLLRGNPLVCIHDAARPFIDSNIVIRVVEAASLYDGSAVGVKAKSTIKICNENQEVLHTPDRSSLWEIQTPQVVRLKFLNDGFEEANRRQLTVTDDISFLELLGKPAMIVEGFYCNIKITTPDDLAIAEQIISSMACHALL
jgi:2-C-methyl-D-erythritol 4-phosphate cytidylyltransferase